MSLASLSTFQLQSLENQRRERKANKPEKTLSRGGEAAEGKRAGKAGIDVVVGVCSEEVPPGALGHVISNVWARGRRLSRAARCLAKAAAASFSCWRPLVGCFLAPGQPPVGFFLSSPPRPAPGHGRTPSTFPLILHREKEPEMPESCTRGSLFFCLRVWEPLPPRALYCAASAELPGILQALGPSFGCFACLLVLFFCFWITPPPACESTIAIMQLIRGA